MRLINRNLSVLSPLVPGLTSPCPTGYRVVADAKPLQRPAKYENDVTPSLIVIISETKKTNQRVLKV